jgi:hydrogenase maturation protease
MTATAADPCPSVINAGGPLGRGASAADILVVGCGNFIRGDDAVGPILVRMLAERTLRRDVRLVDAGTAGMDVAFAMRGVRRVIVVDASRIGVPAGTIHHVPGEELVDLAPPEGNLHQFRWDQALGFARWLLAGDYPEQVEVWLLEGAQFDPGAPLSPAVQESLDRLVETLAQELGAGDHR